VSPTTSAPEGFRTRGDEPKGTRLVLIRHGEAYCNARGVVGGPIGCGGLTDRGRAQARALNERLMKSREFDDAVALYTSVLPRSIETARIIAPGLPRHLVAIEDCQLCELHPGESDGMTWAEMVSAFGGPDWDQNPDEPFSPGGESWTGFYERCRQALTRIAAKHPGQRVILVVHGGVIEQAMKMVESAPAAKRLGLRTENCSMTEVEFDDERQRLLRYNDLAPLAAR
jgi:probable phosphoglycerate mutase